MRQKRGTPLPEESLFTGLGDLPYQDLKTARHKGGFELDPEAGECRVSATDFLIDVSAVAKGLIATGIAPGDRLILACGARYEWAVVAFAAWAVRAVVVPVSPFSSAGHLQHVIRDTQPAAAIVERAHHSRAVAQLRREFHILTRAWHLDAPLASGPRKDPGIEAIKKTGVYMDRSAVLSRRQEATRNDIALIAHPTTGKTAPRGVVLTHGNLLASASSMVGRVRPLLNAIPADEASVLMALSPASVFGQCLLTACVMAGVRVGFPPGPSSSPEEDLQRFAPTIVMASPSFLEEVYTNEEAAEAEKASKPGWDNLKAFNAAVEHAVEFGRSGRRAVWRRLSHAMHEWLYARVRSCLGERARVIVCTGQIPERLAHFYTGVGMPVVQGFGLPETSGPFTLNVGGESPGGPGGTVRSPIPAVQVRVSPDHEVEVRGDTVFRGYWNAPEATRRAFREGWLRTGLIGRLAPEGLVVLRPDIHQSAPTPPPAAPTGPPTAPEPPPPERKTGPEAPLPPVGSPEQAPWPRG
ncbi:AMP-binding protein [Allosalinactinospora lopnorensis]|uniref:AMP-binding protein n=1 Tax=Allosalinactinospora lopnorensis TaxID=1352348 RepID=UPI000698AD78|nr:AMP-binding protein [Allosalinactinospora lopnorensis]